MRNLRYFGSSNLSPLAPPFTVDRSHSNTLNSNPISLSNNPSSSYSTKEFIQSTAGEEFLGDLSVITTDYGYIGSDSITNSTTHHNWFDLNSDSLTPAWSAANPSPNRVIDSFYPSKVEIDDGSLVGFDFSASGVVHRHETDYTQELSGLKYNPNPNPNFKKEGASIGTSLFADNSLNESHFTLRNPSTVKSSPIVIKPPPAPISTLKDTKKSSASDQMNFEFKASQGDVRVPDIHIPDTAASSVDHHNSAEDSPCWKGTPFLQFGSAEVLSGHEEVAVLQDEIREEGGDSEVDASRIVKELCNLSDLLLSACSSDGLKKHDLEALERATRNLGVYVSRKVDQSAPASAKKVVKKDKELLAHYKIMKADVSGVNMVQAIKKVLEENLKVEVEHLSESDGSLYRSLWLEAEAELCCLGYRARLDRLKRGRRFQVEDEGTAAGIGSDWEHILKDEVS